ncbi:MAG TPA: RNA-binding transcriptional accessory protein [Candidatus Marinimicrobia bacterium]|nr:RNA-binding transcriptional accessory protein [Candidatus Neomarinimicrobiota bacterium]
MNSREIKLIAEELSIKTIQVEKAAELLSDGNTVPFIARYRKELTMALDEEQLRHIESRMLYFNKLRERKITIIQTIEKLEKLTPELMALIEKCVDAQELEDIYLPYKPKKRTRATIAKEKGLQPLADRIYGAEPGDLGKMAAEYLSDKVKTVAEALQGASDILAEHFNELADLRGFVRFTLQKEGLVISKAKEKSDKLADYEMYHEFAEAVETIPAHRILAINRGEKEDALRVTLDLDSEKMINLLSERVLGRRRPHFDFLKKVMEDSYKRLIFPSVERELRHLLSEKAEKQAVEVFAKNLYQLLMQPPVRGKRIIGIDPAYRTGCKVAVISETGNYLAGTTIYPTPPHKELVRSEAAITELVQKYKVEIIAIGNGTASRETAEFIASLIKKGKINVKYTVVNEAGASVYSASPIAKEEFPELEASTRGNISIARRLQDPLAELVKIDPKSIGVGQYQHDVNQNLLMEALDKVIESAVNSVGVDVNTASRPLLERVSGLNKTTARNIVQYRNEKGALRSREELLKVKGIGAKAYQQAAGFLKIYESSNWLDHSTIHPESYDATKKIFKKLKLNFSPESAIDIKYIKESGVLNIAEFAEELNIGRYTLNDIFEALIRPDRDPREEMPPVNFREDVLRIEDLKEGMKVKGAVQNITDFGAFIDLGLKNAGLVHISKMAKKFVKNPHEVLKVGQQVEATVISLDIIRGRIGLSLID